MARRHVRSRASIPALVLAVAVSPDGKTLLTGSADKNARLFNLADGTLKATLTGHNGPIQGVGFAPKGDRVVTAGEMAASRSGTRPMDVA